MDKVIPRNFLWLGRGYHEVKDPGSEPHYRLSKASMARVDALTRFYVKHPRAQEGLIVCSGGQAGMAYGQQPIPGVSEGKLAADELIRRGIYNVEVEGNSDSTIGNYKEVVKGGYFDGIEISPEDPLGTVASRLHYSMRAGPIGRAAFNRSKECFRLIPSGEWYARDVISETLGGIATARSLHEATTDLGVNLALAEADFKDRLGRFRACDVLALVDKSRIV